ncbi:MAG: type II toxin-antitoxin system RelE/ParE family toxin [Proteobacteria bacterium]|nr:type II toxin-antitoxin system RelE/ParE family toxin [Pseudomonadota bacterium]
MARYTIVFAPAAERQFMALPTLVRPRVAHAIAKLADDPLLGKQLKAELSDYRSFRVGDYRVIYFIRKNVVQVEIIRISHRKEAYR